MREERREQALKLRVGVFVLVALAAFLGTIYVLGARTRLFEPHYSLHAEFTEVGGLAEGATVRLAGVQIGRVSGVNLPGQPGGKVRVELSISTKYADRIRGDSVARIETQGLLGDKIVEITVGSAQAPPAPAGHVLAARDPMDLSQIVGEGAQTVKSVANLADSLRNTAETLNQSKIIEDFSATARSARRIAEQVEKGSGWAHVLLYEEPVALRRLNQTIATTNALIDRLQRGEGAAGVLLSAESTAAAKRFVGAMDRIGRLADRPSGDEGLVPALLFDPKYKAVLDDLKIVTENLRDISERVAGGRGTLGSLVRDEADDGGMQVATQDLKAAMANLRSITEKINEGEGTIGALVADPAVYDRLVTILDGAQRSTLLRFLIRSLDKGGKEARGDPGTKP